MTRTLYIREPAIWKNAALRAELLGISLGQYVEQALVAHIKSAPACSRCDEIRRILDRPVVYRDE